MCRELYSINKTVNIELCKNYIKLYVNNETIGGGFTLEPNDSEDVDKQCIIKSDNLLNLAFALSKSMRRFCKVSTATMSTTRLRSRQLRKRLSLIG